MNRTLRSIHLRYQGLHARLPWGSVLGQPSSFGPGFPSLVMVRYRFQGYLYDIRFRFTQSVVNPTPLPSVNLRCYRDLGYRLKKVYLRYPLGSKNLKDLLKVFINKNLKHSIYIISGFPSFTPI